ncbi:MAG: lysophospholipid acyltransferase family protein [Pseudomonadota bacterium]
MQAQGRCGYVKLVYMVLILLSYILFCTPFYPIFFVTPDRYRRVNARLVSALSKLYLKLLGFRIRVVGPVRRVSTNCLITSNHLSYLDVLVIASLFPGCFITSTEIQQTPFLGRITALAGCLFVERRSRNFLGKETWSITNALKNRLNVILFPEGTSTNGDTVLRFRQPLFQAGIDSGVDVLPVCLVYQQIDGQKLNGRNRDRLFWYGDMTFLDHFLGLAAISRIHITVFIENRLSSSRFCGSADLSVTAHHLVSSRYRMADPLAGITRSVNSHPWSAGSL